MRSASVTRAASAIAACVPVLFLLAACASDARQEDGAVATGGSSAAAAATVSGTTTARYRARGEVTGMVPICYGPGPSNNLTPAVTVYVKQNGRLVTRARFSSDQDHKPRIVSRYRQAITR
jgi:hypothetical protein